MSVPAGLGEALAALDARIDRAAVVGRDPVGRVHEARPEDREVVAHVAAMLAYGRVDLVRRAIADVVAAMGPAPAAFVRAAAPGALEQRLGPAWTYRMTKAADLDAVLVAMGRLLRDASTLEEVFAAGDEGKGDLQQPLARYVARLRAALPGEATRGMRYLLADPASGSATKRLHLLLRWLVRPADGVDLGLWGSVAPARLVLPLDTHTGRLVRWLGLTERVTDDYRKAREATDALARITPDDPVRFDLALCHLGIARGCLHRWDETTCVRCPLAGLCVWTRGRGLKPTS